MLTIFAVLVISLQIVHGVDEYQWKSFTGTIPDEALEGGLDSNGDPIFIGQVEVDDGDVLVGPIYSNKSEVVVPSREKTEEIIKRNTDIKILCGSEDLVAWTPANSENLHVKLIEKNSVIGGKLKDKGYVHVGRISYENEIKIGLVTSYKLNEAELVFVHNDTVLTTSMFEILLYNSPKKRRLRPGRHWKNRRL